MIAQVWFFFFLDFSLYNIIAFGEGEPHKWKADKKLSLKIN